MNMIVAVDKNWAIGHKGRLLVSIPEDMRFFRNVTAGRVVIMGRKTLESFPNGIPLKNRVNIVITRDMEYNIKDAVVCNSIEEVLDVLTGYNSEEVYVIGGESVYRQFLPYCDTVHVTRINYEYEADAYFPNLDETGEWKIDKISEEQTYFDLEYEFVKYIRK